MYSDKLIDHFRNPRNMGRMDDPDGVGKVGNPACGDVMYVYIKVNDETEEITDIKFETFGCAAAIGTSSMVTEMAIGKCLADAEKISKKDVADELGGLPPIKMHCSVLAADGIKAAIEDYRKKKAEKE
jgi:nitrogen fixation NifU-like protein